MAAGPSGVNTYTADPPAGFSPSQIRHAYGIDAIKFGGVVGDGTGQTIAIIDDYYDPSVYSDLQYFDSQFGLPDPPHFEQAYYTTNTNGGDWFGETAMDVEWAHAIAPGANILLVEANAPETDLNSFMYYMIYDAVNWARQQTGVSVVSMSWGGAARSGLEPGSSVVSMSFGAPGDELPGESNYDSYFTTPAAHNGVTFVASAGDHGAPGIYPAFSPNVLAVGGTSLYLNGNNYSGETVWNSGYDNQGVFWATGGGLSSEESRPGYQNGVAGVVGSQRGIPDVAFDADLNTGVWVYASAEGGWEVIGGTSLSAPCWAGLIAIADQGRTLRGLGTLDGATQTLPLLYQISPSDFHDITVGGNGTYAALPGYDLCTGLGSPVANLLVPDLAGFPRQGQSETMLYPAADTMTAGQAVTMTAYVSGGGPFVATGTVAFYVNGLYMGVVNLQPAWSGLASASISISFPAVGTYNIIAVYSGNANYADSFSTLATVTATPVITPITANLGAYPNTLLTINGYGFDPNVAHDSVKFSTDGMTVNTGVTGIMGPANLTSLTVWVDGLTSLPARTPLYASVTVDGVSSGWVQVATVVPATLTFLTLSREATIYGQPLTLTARVEPYYPNAAQRTGTVTFFDGTTLLATVALKGSKSTFTINATNALNVGTHSLTAVYGNDPLFGPSISAVQSETVTAAKTHIVLTVPASAVFGQVVTLTAKVISYPPSGAVPTGSVTFFDGTTPLGTVNLTGGKATFTTSTLPVGKHTFVVVYNGNAIELSSSAIGHITIKPAVTKIKLLVLTPNPAPLGAPVTLTAQVSVVAPGTAPLTGTVTFRDGTTVLGTANVVNGVATLTVSTLTEGKHRLTADYAATLDTLASLSPTVTESID